MVVLKQFDVSMRMLCLIRTSLAYCEDKAANGFWIQSFRDYNYEIILNSSDLVANALGHNFSFGSKKIDPKRPSNKRSNLNIFQGDKCYFTNWIVSTYLLASVL